MAAVPISPRFPVSFFGEGCHPAHLLTVASALRLSHLVHLCYAKNLGPLLGSSLSREYYRSAEKVKHEDNPCLQPCIFKHYHPVEKLYNTIFSSYSTCLSFFSEKEFGNAYVNKHKFQLKTSVGSSSNKRSWTNILLAFNILAYLSQIVTRGKLLLWGAKVNALIDKGQLWRLVTSSFLHADIGHLMVNCYSLNSVGPTVEQLSGPGRFLVVYLTSAISSSLTSYYFCQSSAVGASGAIFGLVLPTDFKTCVCLLIALRMDTLANMFNLYPDQAVGSFSMFILRHRSIIGGGKDKLKQIAHVIALNMAIGMVSRGIDNWGHLGGLLGGAIVSWLIGPEWTYESHDGRFICSDMAPIKRLIGGRKMR